MKCIGNCSRHKGKVKTVTIHAHGLDSTPLPYCDAAIWDDIESGYVVRILPENHEWENALWLVGFLVLLATLAFAF